MSGIDPVLAKAYDLEEPLIEKLTELADRSVAILGRRALQLEEENARLIAENTELKNGSGEAGDQPMMTKDEWTVMVDETIGLKTYALDVHADSKLQHLIHILIGYREYVITFGEDTQPYSPGSARDISWRHGRELAAADLKKRELNRKRNTGTSPASSA